MKKAIILTLLIIPLLSFGQLTKSLVLMEAENEAKYSEYEQLFHEATEYIFSNPVNFKSNEFVSACKIVDFWKNKDTGINVPIFGSFYNKLEEKSNLRYFYMIAITNYILNEKINKNRILECEKIDGQKYSEQEDVKEVQLEGAKIFLAYVDNEKNGLSLNKDAKAYLKAFKKGKLEDMFFD
ncbi:hypothetical protein [Maribacter aurantiacus]|uniref:Uncharacterized protein n=1 Tax=Maribacter aurantiacus TaxID=1882343 RepID=A0A5R8LRB5_9FLAO|nr:hypothetical protein [Maribacter aurantiacus]TLF39755.1 hypothetical protein FEK29_17755 [Maribacter aurantiacus]